LHLQGSQTLDLRGLLFPLNHSPEKQLQQKNLEPPPGAAPARFLYKRNQQAAAWRRNKWSQSPVLPWARRAYETRLSCWLDCGVWHGGHKTGAPTRSCTELASLPKKCIAQNALGALKLVGARRLACPRLSDSESGGSAIPRQPRAGNWRP
jgi:hypothetical protein